MSDSEQFDPLYQWLGIPPKDQPPNCYRLLGIEVFESNPDVIANAADQRMAHVRTFQNGPHAALSQQLLNKIAQAKLCLLTPAMKAEYDRRLRKKIQANRPTGSGIDLPKPPPLAGLPQGEQDDSPLALVTGDAPSVANSARSRKSPSGGWIAALGICGLIAAAAFLGYSLTGGQSPSPGDNRLPSQPVNSGAGNSTQVAAKVAKTGETVPGAKTKTVSVDDPGKEPVSAKTSDPAGPTPKEKPMTTENGKPQPKPKDDPPENPPVDLLAAIDLTKHQISGQWQRDDESLVTPRLGWAALSLAYQPPRAYDLLATVERIEGDNALYLGLVAGGKPLAVALDSRDADVAGGAPLSALLKSHGETLAAGKLTHKSPVFENGKPCQVKCRVRSDGLKVSCDDKVILDYQGDFATFAANPFWLAPGGSLFLGSRGRYRVTRLRLVELDGEGHSVEMAQKKDPRRPVPDQNAQLAAEKNVRQSLGKLYAKNLPTWLSAGDEMIRQARSIEDNPAARWVLLHDAVEHAVAEEDYPTAWAAVDQMAADFQVDAAERKFAALEQAAEKFRAARKQRQFAYEALPLVDEARRADRLDLAERILSFAQEAAKKSRDPKLRQKIVDAEPTLARQKTEQQQAQQAAAALALSPDHPAALETLGYYRCCVLADWPSGLSCLAAGSDDTLRALAAKELTAAESAQIKFAADAWWQWAEKQPGQVAEVSRAHAAELYRRALPEASRVTKREVHARLVEWELKRLGYVPLTGLSPTRFHVPRETQMLVNRAPVSSPAAEHKACREFIYAYAPATLTFAIPEGVTKFSTVGFSPPGSVDGVRFGVLIDGKTPIFQGRTAMRTPIAFVLPKGAATISLVTNGNTDREGDHCFFCQPRFLP